MKRLPLFLGLLLLVPGCVRSLHPVYTEAQLVYDPTVNGTWIDDKKENKLVITGDGQHNVYNVAYTDDKNKTGHFEVHLAKLDNTLLADVAPGSMDVKDDQHNDESNALLLPVHTFMLVTYNAQSIRLRAMNYDWFKKYVKDHPDAIKFDKLDDKDDDNLILTAPTDELQAFILKNLSTADAWGDWTEFHWIAPATNP